MRRSPLISVALMLALTQVAALHPIVPVNRHPPSPAPRRFTDAAQGGSRGQATAQAGQARQAIQQGADRVNAMLKPIAQDKPIPTLPRAPRGHMGFSWARFPVARADGIEYRLFRRDLTGRLYLVVRQYQPEQSRAEIAANLWRARIALRERVDEIVLAQLGLQEEVACAG